MTFCHKPYPIDKGKEDSAMNEFKGSSKYVVSEDPVSYTHLTWETAVGTMSEWPWA